MLIDCYDNDTAMQVMKPITFREPYQRGDDLGQVFAVHLHGYVRTPKDGYVFSNQHYGASAARNNTWFTVLGDEFPTSPFVVVGCSLAEPDLEYYLAKRQAATPEGQQLYPSLFVAKKIDIVLKKRCERFGLVPVEAESDEFFAALARQSHPRPTPLELILPKLHADFLKMPPEKSQRVFFRQWVDDTHSLPRVPHNLPKLLRGTEPKWEHLEEHEDVLRSTTTDIVLEVSNWVKKPAVGRDNRVRLLVSSSGEGRSTIMMRSFLELAKSGIRTFYYVGQERLADEAAFDVLSVVKRPVVLFVDSVAEAAHSLARLCDFLRENKVPYFVVCAERVYRKRFVLAAFSNSVSVTEVRPLSKAEATALVAKMRSEGLLGRNARHDNAKLADQVRARGLFPAILSLWSASAKLASVVQSEWNDVQAEDARAIYALVALAHKCGYPTRTSLISRASGVGAARVTQVLRGDLNGIVLHLPPMGEFVETRHRFIAEQVVLNLPPPLRYQTFLALAKALAPYVNRKAIIAQTVEARLASRLLNLDDTVRPLLGQETERFYQEIKPHWEWNSRYWEQLALLELERGRYTTAIDYAEHGVGIERHPFPLTTLAKVRFAAIAKVSELDERLRGTKKALDAVDEAIEVGRKLHWREPHPYDIGIRGCLDYLEFLRSRKVFSLDHGVRTRLRELLLEGEKRFPKEEFAVLRDRYDELVDIFR